MESLTYERAVELAREVVAEFGEEYTYPASHKRLEHADGVPSCVYVHEGRPSCLVSQILHRHGVSLDELANNEFRGAWFVAGDLAGADAKTRLFLDVVQSNQDGGTTWAQAVNNGVLWMEENHV